MRFTEYLIEATQDPYAQFSQEYESVIGEKAPTRQRLVGLLNRRSYSPGGDESTDFITDWFMKRGYLTQKGRMVVPTPKGSQLRQVLSSGTHQNSDLTKAAGNFKKLRRYFMDITDQTVRDWLETLDEQTLEMIAKGRELEEEDVAILKGIEARAKNHRERSSYITSMFEKNPDRLDRLSSLGFLDAKNYTFNRSAWQTFINTISSLDPARVRTVIPRFFQWATHAAGNTAKNVNRILFAIHPDSRNQTSTGKAVWRMLENLPDDVISTIQSGKKPQRGEMSDGAYNLLTTVVASVIRTFPNAKTSEELIKLLDDAFESRVDFKSLDRSGEKVAGRRGTFRDMFR